MSVLHKHIVRNWIDRHRVTGKIKVGLRIGSKGGVSVKKIGIVLFCISFCLAVLFILPQAGKSNLTVDDSGCLECHDAAYPDGTLHSQPAHSDCTICHDVTGDTPSSSTCINCHPLGNPGKCELVLFHEDSTAYDPSGTSCLTCHSDCDGGETTTTTTTSQATIKGNRYEVFLVGSGMEGCSATTMNFRSDNVLILECLDGVGNYISMGNYFTAFYWANNYYKGYGMGLFLSGIALDPYIIAVGIGYFGNNLSPVVLTGYILSTS